MTTGVVDRPQLTPMQAKTLIRIRSFRGRHKRYPTTPELGRLLGISQQKAFQCVRAIRAKKFLPADSFRYRKKAIDWRYFNKRIETVSQLKAAFNRRYADPQRFERAKLAALRVYDEAEIEAFVEHWETSRLIKRLKRAVCSNEESP